VIVDYTDAHAAAQAVTRLGGHVDQQLDAVGSLTADVPGAALARLRATAGVTAVTEDGQVQLNGAKWDADGDENSMYNITDSAGAQAAWASGITGKGVDVALIDSGITPVNGLADPARVINGPDLSFESQAPNLRYLDTFGHGTHMAGIIAGIVVVVSAGNNGTSTNKISMPAANPYVIAVGAADSHATTSRIDDTTATLSSRGNGTRHPDLVASGRSVVSLRNPGSCVDDNYPTGLIAGDEAKRFFRGSGTSQAAAVVSGAAALLLQQRPALTPDQVKRLLTGTADAMPLGDAAIKTATPTYKQTFAASTGPGTLEKSRGGSHVADPVSGTELTGEKDIMGKTWTPSKWAPNALSGRTWSGGTWNGTAWTGSDWTGTTWSGRTWSGTYWSSSRWG